MLPTITLKRGRESSLLRRHPWVFSGAIEKVSSGLKRGETIHVLRHDGAYLATAAYSPESQIRARVWAFDPKVIIDRKFFQQKLNDALQLRHSLLPAGTSAYRWVNAESDGLPGLVVDKYGDYCVVQYLSAGCDYWKETINALIVELMPCKGLYERSDVDVRKKEGLLPESGVVFGEQPPQYIEIQEHDLRFYVDIVKGHKTGFYLDQRDNRALVAHYAADKTWLNCFAYTGGFGLAALKAGATTVTQIEASADAAALMEQHIALNELPAAKHRIIVGDVFKQLRAFREQGIKFDAIVLDPPKFAESKQQLPGACRGYKDINLLAFQLLNPGGLLFTFSCSGLLSAELFQKIVADAALDAGREARLIHRLYQGVDHPLALPYPEGLYLKGLVCVTE